MPLIRPKKPLPLGRSSSLDSKNEFQNWLAEGHDKDSFVPSETKADRRRRRIGAGLVIYVFWILPILLLFAVHIGVTMRLHTPSKVIAHIQKENKINFESVDKPRYFEVKGIKGVQFVTVNENSFRTIIPSK